MNEYKLKELLEIKNGADWKKYNFGQYPVYGSGGVIQYIDKYIYNEESILLPRKGSLDKILYVNKPFWTVDTMYWTKINKELVEPYYLFYYLKIMDKSCLYLGTGVPSMTFDLYYDIKVKLPSREVQKNIANFLLLIDSKIESNCNLNEELDRMIRTIYDYWFLQYEFPNKDGKPYKSSGGKMIFNKEIKQEIPEKWELKKLVNVVSKEKNAIVDGPFGTQMKIDNYVDNGIPVVEMENLNGYIITDRFTKFIGEEKYIDVARSTVKPGDIIISKTGTLGLLGLMNDKVDKAVLVSRLAKITPDNSVIGKNTLLLILKKLTENNYWLNKSTGSTMPIINNDILKNTKIVVPNVDIMKCFENLISPMTDIINKNLETNKELTELRDMLLPLLMNGKIKIDI